MAKREKIALFSVIIYIFIMGIGMILLGISDFSYDGPEMVKIIVYFEIIMSVFAFLVYKKLGLHIFTQTFRYTQWLLPFILIFILMIVFLIFTGNFSNHFPLMLLVGLTTLLVGFSEELMFRGILLNIMLERRSIVFSLITSSIAFSLLHAVNFFGGVPLIGVPLQLILTFVFGLIFSCLAILIKNIIPLMVYHFVWDFVLVSQPLTRANIHWFSAIGIIIETVIIIPLFIYTVKFVRKNGINF
ncbi:hypothetical protein RN70_11695 [Staphylococcus schleiferi]|uniref:CPBP family intramembrane glutamic endopeptidase n=1 Tax=Staphylococcus coagulans TaxID=74706 RepID=UPI000679F84A|nr:type II CAAX endopeptidase family protein [Staphylococcus coagulans]AKS70097.1 hypothetical protein NP71_11405 [Staphylococcus schleiferi]AKS72217.1 hypothetical protein OA96_10685 [Staphylococcus schleiferi]AKS74504.1 hypothetical protein RN70_11695 [Staphylococcus schleiferi]MBT2833713.1 CPBP family intramembrane metalloprotease [Staphylococcus coagulans]